MAKQIKLQSPKTYASEKNVANAVEKIYADIDVCYVICQTDDGRFYPVFIGNSAIENRVFMNFCVVN